VRYVTNEQRFLSFGGEMDYVFQALIDRSRVLLDLQTVKTKFFLDIW